MENLTFGNDRIKTGGRHVIRDGVLYLTFSGSSLEFDLEGTKASARIRTDLWEDPALCGYLALFHNGVFVKKIQLDKETADYDLFDSETPRKVRIRLVRLSETNFGKAAVLSLSCEGKVTRVPDRKRKIEFIGDSITCGYGVEGVCGTDNFSTSTENPLKAYAMLTAEALDAEATLVSWSGNGLISHYIPPEVDTPDASFPLMQDVYRYADVAGFGFEGLDSPEDYDFSGFTPDTVVINLGTNDQSYTRGHEDRVRAFGDAFEDFIKVIREKRPNARIIAVFGVMGQDLCDEEERRINKLCSTDKNLAFLKLDLQKDEDGLGVDFHPSAATHKKVAEKLISYIKRT